MGWRGQDGGMATEGMGWWDGDTLDSGACGGGGGEGVSGDRMGSSGMETVGWGPWGGGDRALGLVGRGWTGPGRWGRPVAAPRVLNPAAPRPGAAARPAGRHGQHGGGGAGGRLLHRDGAELRRGGGGGAPPQPGGGRDAGAEGPDRCGAGALHPHPAGEAGAGGTLVSGHPCRSPPQPADPRPCRRCSWRCRCWCSATGTGSSARGPSPPATSSPSSSTRVKSAATCR